MHRAQDILSIALRFDSIAQQQQLLSLSLHLHIYSAEGTLGRRGPIQSPSPSLFVVVVLDSNRF